MTVYARGYRPYEGGFNARLPALTIAREELRIIRGSTGFRILAILMLVIFSVFFIVLYIQLNQTERFQSGRHGFDFAQASARFLTQIYASFFSFFVGPIVTLLVLLSGAGLIADDVRTKGLQLYLVRPLRPLQYVMGKALILPAILFVFVVVPGLLFYVFTGIWQPGGTTAAWLGDHLRFPMALLLYYASLAAGLTGVMLFLSSISERRGWIRVFAVAVFFGGMMVASLGMVIRGTGGTILGHFSIVGNARLALLRELISAFLPNTERALREMALDGSADPRVGLAINWTLLAIGLFFAWRRARSVEVSA